MATSLILRPNTDSSVALATFGTGSYHYDRLNEVTADDTDGIKSPATGLGPYDRFGLPDTVTAGLIKSVEVHGRFWTQVIGYGGANVGVYVGSTEYMSAGIGGFPDTPIELFASWTTNPNTGIDWTWTDINNLQIIVQLQDGLAPDGKGGQVWVSSCCPQLWTVVNYEPFVPIIIFM